MDMNASYNILVEQHLPHAEIVYDRYHMQALSAQPDMITEFDPMRFSVLVDHATVYPEKRIVFTFNDKTQI